MRLFLLRHADAVEGSPDAGRDLSPKGQRQVAELAKGVGRVPLATVPAIEHSPLVRAVRTAQMLRMLGGSSLPLKVLPGLEPAADPRKTAAQLGKTKFAACAACHGPEGKGNPVIGAPNLTDKIWLHGWGEDAIVAMVNGGKVNQMPAQEERLTASQIHVLTAYVWGLSNK